MTRCSWGSQRKSRGRRGVQAAWTLAVAWMAIAGCEPPAAPHDIVPDSALARRAIETAMDGWKRRLPTGRIESSSPGVQVIDAHRVPGQTLLGYEILAEAATSRARSFSLRLDLASPEERPIVRFLVVGIDPVLVFREEDHDLMMHWEHKMNPDAEENPPGPPPVPSNGERK